MCRTSSSRRTAIQRIEIDHNQDGDQWTALPFGLHSSTYCTGRLAQVVDKTLSQQGVHLIWYVDDIIILGDSQKSVSNNLELLLQTCKEAG